MGESHDLASLDWVQANIEKSLQQAQESLEAYLENAVPMHLQGSYDAVHQVRGSLQMAGIPGAVMLAEQVEMLLKGMLNSEISDLDGACNALAQALVYMPAYLNRVRNNEQDSPALLHTVMNDVRRVLGAEPIDERLLFNPDIGAPRERSSAEVKSRFDSVSQSELRKLRQVYQFALIGLIRKEDTKVNTARLSNVLARLQQICQDAPINQLWEVSTAYIEYLLVEGIELHANSLDLLRNLEREIKEFIRAGVFALDRQAHPELLKNMLYFIAKSGQSGPHIQSIRQAYDLDRYGLVDVYGKKTGLLAGPDPETFRTVAMVLTEELERIKDLIDLYVRSSDKANIDLSGVLSGLNQISSTLVMLNLEAPRVVVQEQIDNLSEKLQSGTELPDALLLQTAEALLFVEAELESLTGRVKGIGQNIPNSLAGAAADVVISESLSSLRKAKDGIHEFLGSDENFSLLERVPNILRSAYGGLAMLSQSIPAQLILSASQYVEDDMLALQCVPDGESIEALAEVLASVEFCLEGVAARQPVNEAVLARAKLQIAKLGYPVEQTNGISSADVNDVLISELELPGGGYGTFDWGVSDAENLSTPGTSDIAEQDQIAILPETVDFESADKIAVNFENCAEESEEKLVEEESFAERTDVDKPAPEVDLGSIEYDSQPVETPVEISTEIDPSNAWAHNEQLEEDEDEDELVDDEILEIFSEEAQEVFSEIDKHWPLYAQDYNNTVALTEVRRAFHTLKGSGRMVKANFISELSWSIENLLNRIIDGEVSTGPVICNLINEVRPVLPMLLAHFEAKTSPQLDIESFISHADRLASGDMVAEALICDETSASQEEPVISEHDRYSEGEAEKLVETLETLSDIERSESEGSSEIEMLEALIADGEEPDAMLYELFVKEAEQHLATLEDFLCQAESGSGDVMMSDALYRAMHTLKGSAKMSFLEVFASVATPLERLVLTLLNAARPIEAEVLQALRTGHALMSKGIAQILEKPLVEIDGAADFITELDKLQARYAEQLSANKETLVSSPQAFIKAHANSIWSVADNYELWRQQPEAESSILSQIQENIRLLLEAGQQVRMPSALALLAAIDVALHKVSSQQVTLNEKVLAALDAGNEGLIAVFDQIAASEIVADTHDLVNRLDIDLQAVETDASELDGAEHFELAVEAEDESLADEETNVSSEKVEAGEEIDVELIEIFLEEADDILEQASAAKHRWIDDSNDDNALDELQRCLHTLKGGARMAGIAAIGDLSHELESLYEMVADGSLSASPKLYEMVHACDDCIMDMLGELRTRSCCSSADDLINKVRQFRESGESEETCPVIDTLVDNESFVEVAAPLLQELTKQIQAAAQGSVDQPQLHSAMIANLESFQNAAYYSGVNEAGDLSRIFLEVLSAVEPDELADEQVQGDLADWLERINTSYQEAHDAVVQQTFEKDAVVSSEQDFAEQTERKSSQDNVRVSAALLEQLVNLAGETSVSRSRIEQQMNRYGYSIDEVGSTIVRLREQLRRLENETENQILFRQEREGPTHEGFDPLEMDRYSRMQELSRALMESVSDLLDLKETLREQVRVTENLLLQQSRTNTELHEGLMKARMIPFSRLVPRLRRIARQVSGELNKDIDIRFHNADAELDRSLLEHMTAPLEHMLRNALDHGIESAALRQAAGKPAVGVVTLRVRRDGGDIVLELRDDGAGIDIERVRAKAIENGLMAVDTKLSDHEILQFILLQGFSTAAKITQISGRGVGMDVAHSEIRQLGGSISIDSELGHGTCFTIRLPFTVSITRALMVNVAEDVFALPLSSIEGVVRINPYELEEYYRETGPDFEYAGVKYDLYYLGDFLGRSQAHQVQSGVLPLPVILVRTSEHAIAVQVDSISGSREVVVKPLGPQFNNVPGMSGATILGDGKVVLILDMASMIREHLAKQGIKQTVDVPAISAAKTASNQRLRVMVVDDSVTVRKVASRLLERHGLEVVLAKDGVEAMTKLQEVVPDIMLLDIEMPRMDGFELASLIRHDEIFSEIPIIMISSRTGDKHQARAREIGVNHFMGKPFQELDLLEAISELTGTVFASVEA